jgi:hypothetical protein
MLDTLITSKTRIKLLVKFFLNKNNSAYLRNLESEFGESSNAIRVELNKFEEAKLLTSEQIGNKKIYKANHTHPLFLDIQNILMKYTGLDQIIDQVVEKLGEVHQVYLIGDLGKGIESPIIDLLFVGNINKAYLTALVGKTEKLIGKKVRYVVYEMNEFDSQRNSILKQHHLLIWEK